MRRLHVRRRLDRGASKSKRMISADNCPTEPHCAERFCLMPSSAWRRPMSYLVYALRPGWLVCRQMFVLAMQPASLSAQALTTAHAMLAGQGHGWRQYLPFVGPAVVASVAYMDPGNFATNVQAGARYGYGLLWVVLLANVVAMLFQAMSAKLGIVTNRNLAEMCRENFPAPLVFFMWAVSEVSAMATDLAEFLGGAIGLALLFHMPLLAGMGVTAVVTYGLLMFEGYGFRPLELIIGAIVGGICLCYLLG